MKTVLIQLLAVMVLLGIAQWIARAAWGIDLSLDSLRDWLLYMLGAFAMIVVDMVRFLRKEATS